MKTNTKVLATLLLALCATQQSVYCWMATLKVMQHPNGHVVRLAGDIHADGVIGILGFEKSMALEKQFLTTIEQPLADFLSMHPREYECFSVEKTARDLLPSTDLFKNVLSKGIIAAVPLFERMNVLGHPKMHSSIKSMVAKIDTCTLKSNIEIIPYDVRANYPDLCEKHITQQHGDFIRELGPYQKRFIDDIKKCMDYKYHSRYAGVIKDKGEKMIQDLCCNIYKPGLIDLSDFYAFTYADFGYLTYIAQNAYKNHTLYLGAAHCHNLSQDLEKMGYKTIFEKGRYDARSLAQGIIPGPLSKKEYQEFFAAGRMKF